MDKDSVVWQNLQRFANEHKLMLEDEGEVGFGRPCVGFLGKGGSFIDYNPIARPDYKYIWPEDTRLHPPNQVCNAYHKHNCLAVLVHGDDYDAALTQLDQWIRHLETDGEVYVDSYETGATGIQAIISGVIGYAIRLRDA